MSIPKNNLFLVKKSNFPRTAAPFTRTCTSLLTAFLLAALTACSSGGGTDTEPPEPEPVTADAVAPDGVLETVTWNLEWYGSYSNGPSDEALQTNNIVRVADSLNADLFAFQEVNRQSSLDELLSRLPDYRGLVADHITYDQRTAVVYNSRTIRMTASGPIESMQDEYHWAGRLPFYFAFEYSYQGQTIPFYAVVIHGKANTGDTAEEYREAYQRRKAAAESLHAYLLEQQPDANIIILGDYNDDVDVSIYDEQESPYAVFVQDQDDFRVLTASLSANGATSTVRYSDVVDHITVSSETEAYYLPQSAAVFKPGDSFISNYGSSTSDHYPVWAKFDIRQ